MDMKARVPYNRHEVSSRLVRSREISTYSTSASSNRFLASRGNRAAHIPVIQDTFSSDGIDHNVVQANVAVKDSSAVIRCHHACDPDSKLDMIASEDVHLLRPAWWRAKTNSFEFMAAARGMAKR